MSDKYGSVQPRALETSELSWDSIVLPVGVPMGSSDVMLLGLAANEKSANAARVSTPSGWLRVGEVIDAADSAAAEASVPSGTVICSEQYPANTFNLIAHGQANLAVVNGWVLNVKGTDTTNLDNYVALGAMDGLPSGRLDLVFLEVWRELITKDSIVYPNGNENAGSTVANDLVNPLAGVETTQRVQIKYRIRNIEGGTDLGGNPDGINPATRAQGAKPDGYVSAYGFQNQAGNGDAGLWRAGDGDDASRTSLGTVDGYSYSIPMFAVYRRGNSLGFSISRPDTTATALYPVLPLTPVVSDRPDGHFYDAVYADDIVDLRHSIASQADALQKTFQKALSGSLKTRRGLASGGSEVPGGSLLTKGDTLGNAVAGVLPLFGTADTTPLMRRAAYCNASVPSHGSVLTYYPGTAWTASTYAGIDLVGSSPFSVVAIYGAYGSTSFRKANLGTDASFLINNGSTMEVTVPPGSWLIGTTEPLRIQVGAVTTAGSFGTLDVPSSYLAVLDNAAGTVIPTSETPIRIHNNDRTSKDEVLYLGSSANSTWRHGVDLRLHRTLSTPDSIVVTLVGGKQYGYEVTGVKSVQRLASPGVYGSHQAFSVTRTTVSNSTNVEFLIGGITNIGGESSTSVRITFAVKTKALELSRQGRGVVSILETKLVSPVYSGGFYMVDTGDKPILSLGTTTTSYDGYEAGTPYALVGGITTIGGITTETTEKRSVTLAASLPLIGQASYVSQQYLPTRVRVNISGTVNPTDRIYVPVVVMSYLEPADSFSLFYKTTAYQGTGSSVGFKGTILAEGPAACSSSGSGAITDYSYDPTSDKALFTAGSRTVSLVTGTTWTNFIRTGDKIWNEADGDATYAYVVASVSSSSLLLEEPYKGSTSPTGGNLFHSARKDSPVGVSYCTIDRMPSLAEDGYEGQSLPLDGLHGTRYLSKRQELQSPLDSWQEDAQVGYGIPSTSGIRGMVGLQISVSGQNPAYPLNYAVPAISYDPVVALPGTYKKAYQSLLFREQSTGRVYMAVVASESGNNALIADSLIDVADIFELVGRPLSKG